MTHPDTTDDGIVDRAERLLRYMGATNRETARDTLRMFTYHDLLTVAGTAELLSRFPAGRTRWAVVLYRDGREPWTVEELEDRAEALKWADTLQDQLYALGRTGTYTVEPVEAER